MPPARRCPAPGQVRPGTRRRGRRHLLRARTAQPHLATRRRGLDGDGRCRAGSLGTARRWQRGRRADNADVVAGAHRAAITAAGRAAPGRAWRGRTTWWRGFHRRRGHERPSRRPGTRGRRPRAGPADTANASARLAVLLRLDPALAPGSILSCGRPCASAAPAGQAPRSRRIDLVRGDADRVLGCDTQAAAAYQQAHQALAAGPPSKEPT